jgi:hypothetical protein
MKTTETNKQEKTMVGHQVLEHMIAEYHGTMVEQVESEGADNYVREYITNNAWLIEDGEDIEKIIDETTDALIDYVVRKHNEKIAEELSNGLQQNDPSYDDHAAISNAIKNGITKGRILEMRETNNWPDTYVFLDDHMYAPGQRL